LVFGLYGILGTEEYDVRGGGSGILVAPNLAITAKHILEDFWNQWEGSEAPRQRTSYSHSVNLFQALSPLYPGRGRREGQYGQSVIL